MNTQPELLAQTKKNLTDAFWELYCQQRIQQITVKKVTDRAGYNRGTFYVYFKDVYDVLEQIEESLLPDLTDYPPKTLLSREPVQLFAAMYERNGKYLSVLLSEKGDPDFVVRIKAILKPIFREKVVGNEVPYTPEHDYILEFMLSAMIGVLTSWFKRNKDIPLMDLINLLHELTSEGILGRLNLK